VKKIAAAGVLAAAASGMAWAVRGRSSSVFGPSVYKGCTGRKAIALTFDDGPSEGSLQILDVLASYNVAATFFQCGMNIERAPELSEAVIAAGHETGNHSWSHSNLAMKSTELIFDEFDRTQRLLNNPRLLRAPFGVRWFGFNDMQERLGLTGVMWTVIGRDWTLHSQDIANRVLRNASDGAIICLHDGRGTEAQPDVSQTIEAVRRIVPALVEQGYHFETVSQILCPMTK
jgi:peptidoglycan/xylan/chitin deacetylase (PgdA/CDA1 family)